MFRWKCWLDRCACFTPCHPPEIYKTLQAMFSCSRPFKCNFLCIRVTKFKCLFGKSMTKWECYKENEFALLLTVHSISWILEEGLLFRSISLRPMCCYICANIRFGISFSSHLMAFDSVRHLTKHK